MRRAISPSPTVCAFIYPSKCRFAFAPRLCYSKYGSSSRVTALAWTGLFFPVGSRVSHGVFFFRGDVSPCKRVTQRPDPVKNTGLGQKPRNKHGVLSKIPTANSLISNFFRLLRGSFRRLRGFRNYYGVVETMTPCLLRGIWFQKWELWRKREYYGVFRSITGFLYI